MSHSVVRLFKLKTALIAALGLTVSGAAHAQCTGNPAAATITSPAPGSTLSGSTTFQWTAGNCVTSFYLFVGSSAGAADLFSGNTGLTQSATVVAMPTDGRTVYVRLYSNANGNLMYNDYTYTAGSGGGGGGGGGGGCTSPAAAALSSPTPGSVLGGASVTFTWTAGSCVTNYQLLVGSSLGASDLFINSSSSNTAATASNLPVDGRTIYVRLISTVNGSTQQSDYTFRAFTTGGGSGGSGGTGGSGGGGGGGGCGSPVAAVMVTPAPGSSIGATVTFVWSAGACVSGYALKIGSSQGGSDYFAASLGSVQSVTVSNLPTDGRTIYVTLTSIISATPVAVNYTYTASGQGGGGNCNSPAAATLSTPANGSTLGGSSQTFTWTAGSCVTQYTLSIGNTSGAGDIYSASQGTNLTATVANLPTDGRNLYVRLTSTINGSPQSNDYSFKAASVQGGCGTPTAATLTSPANSSTLPGSSVSFSWNTGSCVTQYTLSIGNTAGAGDIYSASQGTNQSVTINNLPTDGRTLYVRLTSTINGSPQSNDYSFKAATGGGAGGCSQSLLATLTTPAPNATLTSASQQFVWSAGCNVTAYFLYIGSTPGAFDLYFQSQGTQTSVTINALPVDGRTLYVRLWSLFTGASDVASGWQYNDYVLKAFTNSNACASPAAATMTSPANQSTLGGASQTFTWSQGSCVSGYTLSIGNTAGASDIYQGQGISLSATVSNLPTDGRTLYVRLTSTINGAPQNNDYTYTAYTAGTGCGSSALATMATPTNGTTLTGGSVTFTWNAGCNVTTYFLYVGSAIGGYDYYFQNQGTSHSATVSGLPTDGRTLYIRLWSLFNGVSDISNGWQYNDYTYTAFTSSNTCTNPAGASMISPADGSLLPGSSATFSWGGASCAVQYTLTIGSTAGGVDLYSQTQGTNLNATVTGLPTDGRNLYVRLSTTTSSGGPFVNNYTYKAATATSGCGANVVAQLTSPGNGSNIGTSQAFTWNTGCNALAYYIYIGTTVGQFDIYSVNQHLNTSVTINNIPTTNPSRPLYFRLWTLFPSTGDISSGWQYVDYVFNGPVQ